MGSDIDERELDRWLKNQNTRLIADLIKVIQCPSFRQPSQVGMPFGSGCYEALMTYLDIADNMGFEYYNHEGYCGSVFWGQGEKELGVVTHLDVVASGNGWSFDPFAGKVKGDFIIGRGTQDNKGAAIGALYVLKYFKDHNITLDKRLHLIAGCNEESGMEGIKYFLRNENAPDFSLITDCGFPVCYGEKGHIEVSLEFSIKEGQIISLNGGTTSNSVADFCEIEVNRVALSEKQRGLIALDIIENSDPVKISITSKGKSAHASTPSNGDNAIAKLFNYLVDKFEISDVSNEVIYKIRDIVNDNIGKVFGIECKDNESGSLSVSAGTIRLKDHIIELVLDIRYPVTVDGNEIVEKLSSMRQNLKFDNIHIKHSVPHYYDPDNKKVLYLTNVYNKLTGSNLSPYTIGGGTHARLLPNAVGFGMSVPESPCLFEKGRGLYHQPDEALYIPSLIRAIKIYILAIAGIKL